MRAIPLAALLLLAAASAHAETSSELLTRCAAIGVDAKPYCHGYIAGVKDSLTVKRRLMGCRDDNLETVTPETLMTRYADWTKDHPQHMGDPAFSGMMMMINQLYPCGATQPRP